MYQYIQYTVHTAYTRIEYKNKNELLKQRTNTFVQIVEKWEMEKNSKNTQFFFKWIKKNFKMK